MNLSHWVTEWLKERAGVAGPTTSKALHWSPALLSQRREGKRKKKGRRGGGEDRQLQSFLQRDHSRSLSCHDLELFPCGWKHS